MKTDESILKHVVEEIQSDPQLMKVASQIGVTVKDEVVTLVGMVDYYGQKLAAEKAAQRVRDVKVVAMDLEVKNESNSEELTDSKIAAAVRNALAWNSAVNEDLINIKVEDGWVHLKGTVNWEYERKAAEQSVENLLGIKGLFNQVKIKKLMAEPEDVRKKIRAAFQRLATNDAENIQVSVELYKVKLTGHVRSWTERKDAEDVAWSMPGITEVDNELEVEHETYGGE